MVQNSESDTAGEMPTETLCWKKIKLKLFPRNSFVQYKCSNKFNDYHLTVPPAL